MDLETVKIYKQLKLFQKFLNLIGEQISDYPDSLGFEFTSRLIDYSQNNDLIHNFIESCDNIGPNHSAFVSPYFQQEQPDGFLKSTFNKHREPIKKIIFISNIFLTFSSHKIVVCQTNDNLSMRCMFDVQLPNYSSLKSFFNVKLNRNFDFIQRKFEEDPSRNSRDSSRLKCILNKSFVDQKKIESVNPDLFPMLFLVIKRYFTYIIAPNRELKFFHETKLNEILDVFVIGARNLVIIEKCSKCFYIISDYESESEEVIEYPISEPPNKTGILMTATNFNDYLFENSSFQVDFVAYLEDGEIRHYNLSDSNNHEVKAKDASEEISQDSSSSDFKRPSLHFTDKISKSGSKYFQRTRIKHIQITLVNIFKPCGFDVRNILKINAEFKNFKSNYEVGRFYLCTSDGDFIMVKSRDEISICVLENFTRQTIFEIKPTSSKNKISADIFTGSLRSKDFVYICHSKLSTHINTTAKYEICKMELKGRVDFVQVLDDKHYLLCRDGIIELFKMKCLKKSHKVKLIFSVNSNSNRVTDTVYFSNFNFFNLIF